MTNQTESAISTIWGTWEELLLAYAVKRYGLKNWETVASELQTRSSLPVLLSAQICKDKYRDLKRRFVTHTKADSSAEAHTVTNNEENEGDDIDDGDSSLLWVEELRKRRVAELKQDVQRSDLSIQSLQLKVKELQEERERSMRESKNDVVKPDSVEAERQDNDVKVTSMESPERDSPACAAKSPPGENSDNENISVNESNSTANRASVVKSEQEVEPIQTGIAKPNVDVKPAGGEDSCNDSSDRHRETKNAVQEMKAKGDANELRREQELKEGTKESSDVQSSASLTRRRRRRGEEGGVGDGAVAVSPSTVVKKEGGGGLVKSEPLMGLLDIIRSHKHGSVFESRLDSQRTDKYESLIRQHMDLETIQSRMDNGSYSSCSMKCYLDLLLLFTNAIVFFPKSAPESLAAHELRDLVTKELKKTRNQSSDRSSESAALRIHPKPDLQRSDSLLAQNKSTAPLIVCRKRSSISAKAASATNKQEKQTDDKPLVNPKPPLKSSSTTPNEEDIPLKLKIEKPVTGVRSMRRSGKGRLVNSNASQSAPNSNQNTSSSSQQPSAQDKVETAKTEKKKADLSSMAKKRGAADFLKRIKKNSPAKGGTLTDALKSGGDDVKGSKKEQPKKKVEDRKDGPLRRSGGGGGGNKQVKQDSSPSKRSVGRPAKKGKDTAVMKRGRDNGEGETSSKRPTKRSRR